jgi:DNA-binding GntR family transcriptional regulator
VGRETPTTTHNESSSVVSSATDAYDLLRRAFVLCEIVPGSRVTEESLARGYDLSRAAVRAALARLSHQGWIEASPRRGYLVRPVTLKDIRDLFAVRALLEPAAAEMAAKRATDLELEEIAELARAAMFEGSDYESVRQFLEANTRFHLSVANACGNRKLVKILAEVFDESERMFHSALTLANRGLEMFHEHSALVGALSSRDSAATGAAVCEQVKTAEQMVVDALLHQNPAFDEINLAPGTPR